MHSSSDTFPSTTDKPGLSGIAPLEGLGVIRVAGDDAVSFLQGQLTQDIAQAGASQARLAAFCNPKGRMHASFIVIRRSEAEVLLVLSRDILPQTLKRLSMFVLRAKAKLSDATAEFRLAGLAGTAASATADLAPWSMTGEGAASLITLYPGAGVARALWCAPVDAHLPAGDPLALARWEWLEVQSGIAMITQPIFEAFVPQMLNYESVGGVSFKKGCYPGQEIVARSQFRGTLKRRAYLVHSGEAASVGQDVFHAQDASQPCGTIAAAAESPAGGFDAIVSMQTSAAADAGSGQLRLGGPAGAMLKLVPLPYALLEDI